MVHYNPQQALSIEAVGFYTQFHDLIVIDNIGGTGETENFGRVDSAGLEFSAQYDPGRGNIVTLGILRRLILVPFNKIAQAPPMQSLSLVMGKQVIKSSIFLSGSLA